MTASNRYFDDVLSTHGLIRDWLAGTGMQAEKQANLLARFAPDFSMVAPSGKQLGMAGLAALFTAAAGSRPGLRDVGLRGTADRTRRTAARTRH